jgi:uncharacterized protein
MGPSLDFPLNWFPTDGQRPIRLSVADDDVPQFDGDVRLIPPLHVDGQGYRQQDDVFVAVHIVVEAEYACYRCLDPTRKQLTTTFEMLYRPMATRPDYLEDEDEIGLGYYDEGIICLGEDVRRYLLLELPMWPVCSEECRGLCPQCGVNLTQNACDCAEVDTGPQSELARKLDDLIG